MTRSTFSRDDRGVSIAITHVLTIAITAILISGLLFSAGTMLDTEREQRAQASLETIGERLSSELASVDRLAVTGTSNASLRVEHPREVSGSLYTVALEQGDDCSSPLLNATETCLTLTASEETAEVQVPVRTNASLDTDSSALGGPMTIRYDGTTISLESGHR